jgi:putative aldouronate transport system permease protein
MLPGIAFFLIFSYGPLYGIQVAFKDFRIGLGIWGSEWVGLAKFEAIFRNADFWRSVKNTVLISGFKLVCGFPVPILIAIIINEIAYSKFKRTVQTIITFPHFLSWIIISGIMMKLLGDQGAVNGMLWTLGMEKAGFMTNPATFRGILVATDIWKESGWSCIMYLAAISSIDPSLYESATIDGANRFQRILYITLPGIAYMMCILLILACGSIMNANFDQVFNMYNPSVYKTADIIDTYIYRITFQMKPDYGFSTAVGLFKGVVNMILVLSANKIVKRIGGTSIV